MTDKLKMNCPGEPSAETLTTLRNLCMSGMGIDDQEITNECGHVRCGRDKDHEGLHRAVELRLDPKDGIVTDLWIWDGLGKRLESFTVTGTRSRLT